MGYVPHAAWPVQVPPLCGEVKQCAFFPPFYFGCIWSSPSIAL